MTHILLTFSCFIYDSTIDYPVPNISITTKTIQFQAMTQHILFKYGLLTSACTGSPPCQTTWGEPCSLVHFNHLYPQLLLLPNKITQNFTFPISGPCLQTSTYHPQGIFHIVGERNVSPSKIPYENSTAAASSWRVTGPLNSPVHNQPSNVRGMSGCLVG